MNNKNGGVREHLGSRLGFILLSAGCAIGIGNVWKFPYNNIVTGARLIVNQSQEAIFVSGGQIADVFGPGTHTLSTGNLPILSRLINIPFGKKTPFTAEVW